MQACGPLEKTFGREIEREQKHATGQKPKQLGGRSPVQVERQKSGGEMQLRRQRLLMPSAAREKGRDALRRPLQPRPSEPSIDGWHVSSVWKLYSFLCGMWTRRVGNDPLMICGFKNLFKSGWGGWGGDSDRTEVKSSEWDVELN